MRYICDHDLHIHSRLSLCSNDPEQTTQRILEYAEKNNLKTVCVTDHFWDGAVEGASEWYAIQNFEHISESKPLPKSDKVKFLFGCETEMDKNMNLAISKECFEKFDFVVIPTTHFHMIGLTIGEEIKTPEQKAEFWLKKLNALLDKDLPFHKIGIAHLTCGLIASDRQEYLKTLSLLSEEKLKAVFSRAAQKGVGIEINSGDTVFEPEEADIVLRPYRIAKECGCKFYHGCDAHHPKELDAAKEAFERLIDLLELAEDDKFKIAGC